MNIHELTYRHSHRPNSKEVYIVLHGSTQGIDSTLIRNVYQSLDNFGKDVFAFNFPYIEKGLKPSENLQKEIEALNLVVGYLLNSGYTQISIVAKSLGAIVASQWIAAIPISMQLRIYILGYVLGDVKTSSFKDRLKLVIQGQMDYYGDGKTVEKELQTAGVKAKVKEIAGADHSYRDKSGKPAFEIEAVKQLINNLES